MDRDALSRRLMALFLTELEDHERTLEHDLLALERAGEPAERLPRIESAFRAAHSLKGAARTVQASAIESVCHRLEQSLSELRGSGAPLDAERARRLFSDLDAMKQAAERLRVAAEAADAEGKSPAEPAVRPEAPQGALASPPRAGPAPPSGESPARTAPLVRSSSPTAQAAVVATPSTALRVSAHKLDALLATSSELSAVSARAQTRLSQLSSLREQAARLVRDTRTNRQGSTPSALSAAYLTLARTLEQLDGSLRADVSAISGAARQLDDEVRRLRMVPIREACEGLARTVRDLSAELEKSAELVVEGDQVELDRELVQRVRDPLLHLVRNTVTHGIEPRSERLARGKPATGLVRLEAVLHGSSVEIAVEDDGRGLDLDAIRARAEALGLPPVSLDEELAAYVFVAGLSTASELTTLAGRGVGLDAVKRSIEALHGTVSVQTRRGQGARFTLTLPLTLSKLRCLFLRVAGRPYAIPTAHVVQALRFRPEQLVRIGGHDLVRAGSELVPLVSLSGLLGLPERTPPRSAEGQALVVASIGRSVALVTETLAGERETIVQKLPSRIAGARYVSGATLLGQREVALLLHGSELARSAVTNLAAAPRAHFARPEVEKKRVLVVDDSLTTRALIKSLIEEAGYEVSSAGDGVEALRLLAQEDFDLVVSDVQMPNMDGFTLTERMRSTPGLARIPVVLVTALEGESDRLRGLQAGANAYLGKSAFDHHTLLEVLGGLL